MPTRIFFLALMVQFLFLSTAKAADPTITPSFFKANDAITVSYDVTGTALSSLTEVYAWVWIPGKNIDAKYNINPASADPSKTDNAKFTKSLVGGRTFFSITFTPSSFFATSISNETQMGILLKGNDWGNGQTQDYIAKFWDGNFDLRLQSPTQQPLFVTTGNNIAIKAETPEAADFDLYINNILIDQVNGVLQYEYLYTVIETSGSSTVKLVATSGINSKETTFEFIISTTSVNQPRPPGIIAGINYDQADQTKVTLCLWAPGKNSVYTVGDFNGWNVTSNFQMKKDGEFFWIEISAIIPTQEYAFYYLVDEKIRVSDPYADKILDPDDQYIPESTYPGLKSFPIQAKSSNWYENRVSVFQTAQSEYIWNVNDFQKPAKEGLVVYELLLRDFFDDQHRNYQTLIDTIAYFKRLGITAIELMPIMEFNGNEGWGYNPTFMFAPDKYYGTKNKLKEFIDVCHENGIAVILDIAMNHQDVPNTYAAMYFDYAAFKPKSNNPWFNVTPRHPFNVFFDMNHESLYTKTYLDTITHYWLNEFKADGFRFDLSKGFTQKNNPNDVDAWSAYDLSRINILKRMADKIWQHTPEAYIILEHLSANAEEKELAEYRAAEGKGMMLWGKMTDQYNQKTMGYTSNSNINNVYYANRGWTTPHLVGYMESHDEERLMYKNLQFGNSNETYSVKDETTALNRMKAANLAFYTIPGPKMLWQFGELGYDKSINLCEDGSNKSDCRLSPKPVKWDYLNSTSRKELFDQTADLLRLRKTYDIFTAGQVGLPGGNSSVQKINILNSPYTSTPGSSDDMNVAIIINFDVVEIKDSIDFPHTGTWYNYYANNLPLIVDKKLQLFNLSPGSFKLFTDVLIETPFVTGVEEEKNVHIALYPNPVEDVFTIELENGAITDVTLQTLQGQSIRPLRLSKNSWNISALSPGLYIAEVRSNNKSYRVKMIKK